MPFYISILLSFTLSRSSNIKIGKSPIFVSFIYLCLRKITFSIPSNFINGVMLPKYLQSVIRLYVVSSSGPSVSEINAITLGHTLKTMINFHFLHCYLFVLCFFIRHLVCLLLQVCYLSTRQKSRVFCRMHKID